jgi:hypothetical protein
MKYYFTIALSVLTFSVYQQESNAQNCIEITSILVDACGAPEGENEMVRFDVGALPLNTANMTVTWPNNPWLGLCQNSTTAGIVANINANIQGCGSLTEPVGGVLPAGAKVLLITSVNINTTANKFTNLNENLVVLFQCAGNTSGHFANYNTLPGFRTLAINFSGPAGCTDSVTYDRTLLVNQFGAIGGFTFENDGAFVDFTPSGTPTYLNHGCQVLSSGFALTGGPDVGICPGGASTASLNGTALNMVGNPVWSGGTGTFNPPNALNTVYTPGVGETGLVYLTVTANGPCNSTITDTVRVNIVTSMPSVTVSVGIDGVFSSSITDPSYFYNWYLDGSTNFIPGAFGNTFTPNANGCYYLVISTIGGCTSQSNTACITNVGLNDDLTAASFTSVGNPGSSPSFVLQDQSGSGLTFVEIRDLTGRLISSNRISIRESVTLIEPDWSDINAGLYLVRISNERYRMEQKALLIR